MNRIEELKNKERYTVNDLLTIMEVLRSENGCPWDREQTHESIRQNFIEETYEVVEAIDTADVPLLREELGDVLLQVVFHARISEEAGDFSFDELCKRVHHHMGMEVIPQHMRARIAANVGSERLWIVKILPLFLKNIALRIAFNTVGETKVCLSMSNLGVVELTVAIETVFDTGNRNWNLPSGRSYRSRG